MSTLFSSMRGAVESVMPRAPASSWVGTAGNWSISADMLGDRFADRRFGEVGVLGCRRVAVVDDVGLVRGEGEFGDAVAEVAVDDECGGA